VPPRRGDKIEPNPAGEVISIVMTQKPRLRLASASSAVDIGGPVVFEVLFERYAGYVAGLAARLLGANDGEIDDVVQDVFWLASRRIAKIPNLIQARGWLATVTSRMVRRRLRRRRFRALFHASPRDVDIPAPGASAEDHAVLSRLYEVLASLPTDERLAWSLRYLEGEALEAVAVAGRCSLSTAKRRVSAAKKVIDEVFGDER
jgi:RNA polymerase sigma-70 factor (ECF subfamily)